MSSLWYVDAMDSMSADDNDIHMLTLILLQDDVATARPDIDERVSQLVSKGRWQIPGYKVHLANAFGNASYTDYAKQEKFGDLALL